MKNGELGTRMKKYEYAARSYLIRRTPVIIRVDGKAFHAFTRGMKRPFDEILLKTMQQTMKYLCEKIQGCVIGYTQSDEITLVLIDYKNLNTDPWFDNCRNKIESVSASMATLAFNKYFAENVKEYASHIPYYGTMYPCDENEQAYMDVLNNAIEKGAMFDARAFNVPKKEVCNNLIWRQQDATRNSIQQVGLANFSDKELYRKSCNDIQDMLMTQKGIDWNNFQTYQKRGCCCIKEEYFEANDNGTQFKLPDGCTDPEVEKGTWRSRWIIDKEIPIFTQDRDYIEKLVFV